MNKKAFCWAPEPTPSHDLAINTVFKTLLAENIWQKLLKFYTFFETFF